MHVVLVDFKVKPEFAAAFRPLVLQQAANSLANEEACRRFDVSIDPEDETHFLLYELYDDRAAFDAHVQTEYFARFGAAIAEGVVSKDLSCWEMCDA
ncbi:MAG: putative quinol monooxygenase [Planctomycetota bacterium]